MSDKMLVSREEMPNGEIRDRFMSPDGDGYIRTATTDGGWQNSHFHATCYETYIVQKGWIAVALYKAETTEIRIIREGGVLTIQPMRPHNVFMCERSVIHMVKHGECIPGDWHPHPALDALLKNVEIDVPEDLLAA